MPDNSNLITPEWYLWFKMDDIKAIPNGAEKYDFMENLVRELRKCRNSKVKTQKVLNPFFTTPFEGKEELENWLMKAFEDDDSFVYAYNCMVEDQNFTGYRCKEKLVSERELHTLLLLEQVEVRKQNYTSVEEIPPENAGSNILGSIDSNLKQKLSIIFEKAIKANVIDCALESFLYWFGGRHGKPQTKIRWKKLNNRGSFHKSAFYCFCQIINPDMKPKEMTEICGEKIEPNNSNFSAEHEMLEILK